MAYKDPQAFFGGLIHGEAYIRMGEGGVYIRNHLVSEVSNTCFLYLKKKERNKTKKTILLDSKQNR